MNYDAEAFGTRIRNVRRKNDCTQAMLAEVLMLTEESVSNFENGKTTCMHEHITKICQLFNVSADYFFFGREKLLFIERNNDYNTILDIVNNCSETELCRIRQILPILLAGPKE